MYSKCGLISGIEELVSKRDELHKQILEEEDEKRKLQNDISILTERLCKVNESLSKKTASRNEFDKTIAETEAAYMKVSTSRVYKLSIPFLPLLVSQTCDNQLAVIELCEHNIQCRCLH